MIGGFRFVLSLATVTADILSSRQMLFEEIRFSFTTELLGFVMSQDWKLSIKVKLIYVRKAMESALNILL